MGTKLAAGSDISNLTPSSLAFLFIDRNILDIKFGGGRSLSSHSSIVKDHIKLQIFSLIISLSFSHGLSQRGLFTLSHIVEVTLTPMFTQTCAVFGFHIPFRAFGRPLWCKWFISNFAPLRRYSIVVSQGVCGYGSAHLTLKEDHRIGCLLMPVVYHRPRWRLNKGP